MLEDSDEIVDINELIIEASGCGDTVLVKELINSGADIEAKTKEKCWRTPLICASRNGAIDTVKLLLEKGADVEAKSKYNNTSLVLASYCGHPNVVKLLLEYSADINVNALF